MTNLIAAVLIFIAMVTGVFAFGAAILAGQFVVGGVTAVAAYAVFKLAVRIIERAEESKGE